jgi:Holliday junction resolvase
MGYSKRNAKKDGNQTRLVNQLRACGISVAITHRLGDGFPDIVAGWQGKNYLLEIKDPAQVPSKRKLSKDEEIFRDAWKGQYDIVETLDDVLQIIKK